LSVEQETAVLDDLLWSNQLLWMEQETTINSCIQEEGQGSSCFLVRRAMDEEIVNPDPDVNAPSIFPRENVTIS
jgi:hypothetical protein